MEHLTNCHGEWNALFAMASSLPILGIFIRSKLGGHHENNIDN